jgi:hypothetical protein
MATFVAHQLKTPAPDLFIMRLEVILCGHYELWIADMPIFPQCSH